VVNIAQSEGRPSGWLRWRKDRDILVGCYFNNFYDNNKEAVGENRKD
jgi:hypothetical protein